MSDEFQADKEKKVDGEKAKKPKCRGKQAINIKGLNIDKAEYNEIILSNSNHPDRSF